MAVPFWIGGVAPGRLATMPRPRGRGWLADEMAALRAEGVGLLVSLLTEAESRELDLLGEADAAAACGLGFAAFPVADFTTPPLDAATARFVGGLAGTVRAGGSVVVHCRAGIGRSTILAAAALVALGATADDALARIQAARGRPVPDTDEQRAWVARFAAARAGSAEWESGRAGERETSS